MPYSKLIFVDSDGTCRSAMSKMIMKSKFLLTPVRIESRGLVVLFPDPLDAKACAALKACGYNTENCQAQQLEQKDIGDDVLLLTMEERQKQKIWEQFEHARNVYTLAEFIRYTGDILPLYGEPVESYEEWIRTMEQLLDELVIRLNEQAIHAKAADMQREKQQEVQQETQSEEVLKDDGKENRLSDLG